MFVAATTGERMPGTPGNWHTLPDGGAHDMFDYCTVTKAGTATPGQKAVCGSVPGKCTLQHLVSSKPLQMLEI